MAKVFAMALHHSGSKSMAEALEVPGIQSLNTAEQTCLSPGFQANMQFRVFGSRIKQSILRTLRPLGGSA